MKSILCRNHSTILSNCSFRPTKICYFISFISRIIKSILCRNDSIILSNCSFLFYKDLLLYFGYFTSLVVYFLQNWVYFIIKLFFPLLQRFTSMMHLFYFLLGLFLAELLLFYCQIVISATTKIFYFISFISPLMRSISSRTDSILLSNCSFLYNKDLLL